MKQRETTLEDWLQEVPDARAFVALADLLEDAAVFVVDAERTVIHWNKGAERLLGYRAEEVVGENCLKANRCANCAARCGIAQFKRVDAVPITMYDSDGEPVYVKKSGQAFFDADGDFAGGIEVLTPQRDPIAVGERKAEEEDFHAMASRDDRMRSVFRAIEAVSSTDAPVLIGGESGTGKELTARAIHMQSARSSRPFVAVNCAALVPTLLESELFGHVKGAFTGALEDRQGILSRADGGTLFLDEVAELSLELQAKLLRVVERRCFVPVGGRDQKCVDVRFICATHRSLRDQVDAGKFREDLLYRLRVVPLTLPPLRDRIGDVPLLVSRFIKSHNAAGGRQIESVSREAMARLERHDWPGNVRELQNAIMHAFAVGRGSVLSIEDLPVELRDGEAVAGVSKSPKGPDRETTEAERIRAALAANDGHIGRAAEQLRMSRPTLWRKRRRYGIEV